MLAILPAQQHWLLLPRLSRSVVWTSTKTTLATAACFDAKLNLHSLNICFGYPLDEQDSHLLCMELKIREVGNASDPSLADSTGDWGSFVARQSDPHAGYDQVHIE